MRYLALEDGIAMGVLTDEEKSISTDIQARTNAILNRGALPKLVRDPTARRGSLTFNLNLVKPQHNNKELKMGKAENLFECRAKDMLEMNCSWVGADHLASSKKFLLYFISFFASVFLFDTFGDVSGWSNAVALSSMFAFLPLLGHGFYMAKQALFSSPPTPSLASPSPPLTSPPLSPPHPPHPTVSGQVTEINDVDDTSSHQSSPININIELVGNPIHRCTSSSTD